MSKCPALFVLFVLGCLPALAFNQDSQKVPEAAQQKLERALRLPSDSQRLDRLEKLAREFPPGALADLVRGYRLVQEGKSTDAEAAFRAALAKDPDFAEAHHQLGTLLFARKDFTGARESWERATRIRPQQPRLWKDLGRAWRRLREPARAVAAFRQALTLDPRDIETEKFLAFALDEAGAENQALAQYDRAVQLDAGDARLKATRALLLERMGRKERAERAYESALAVNPSEPMAVTGLALLLVARGQGERALALLERAIRSDPTNAATHSLLGRLYRGSDRSEKAEEHFRRAHELDPANALYAWQYAQLLEASDRTDQALTEYKQGILTHPQEAMFYSSLVQLGLRQRRSPEILAWLEEVAARNPAVAELHAWTGYLYREIGHLAEAEGHYARAVELDRLNREYPQMLAQIRAERRREWRWVGPAAALALAFAIYLMIRQRASRASSG